MTTEAYRSPPAGVASGPVPNVAIDMRGAMPSIDGRLPFGYEPPEHIRSRIKIMKSERSPARTLLTVAGDYTTSALAAWAISEVGISLWDLAVVPLGLLVVARAQRGLEALGHEASHSNWKRGKRVNDALATYLSFASMLGDLETYRTSHTLHHSAFGTDKDSDLRRYRELGLEDFDRSSLVNFAPCLLRVLPRYAFGWFAEVGTADKLLARHFAFLAVFFCTVAVISSNLLAGVLAVCTWVAAQFLVLPIIRLIGESSEHVYSRGGSIFGTTVSNVGFVHRLLFHPHGDGYHAVHHLWPTIPHYRLRQAHLMLMAEDPQGFGARALIRTRVLQIPSEGMSREHA